MRTIYGQKWYRPREIAKLGLIVNSMGSDNEDGNYNFVLNLIKSGQLRAKNYSSGKKMKLYLVPESEIERYHKEITQLD